MSGVLGGKGLGVPPEIAPDRVVTLGVKNQELGGGAAGYLNIQELRLDNRRFLVADGLAGDNGR